MDVGKNIMNAFQVVHSCHQAVQKLLSRLSNDYDKEKYLLVTPKFLRYSSDPDFNGWCYRSFILAYQRIDDGKPLPSSYINGPIYGVQIRFFDAEVPKLAVSKLYYNQITEWKAKISPNEHWGFNQPFSNDNNEFRIETLDNGIIKTTPVSDKVAAKYWKFERGYAKFINLLDIDGDNYKEIIFGAIEELSLLD